MLKKTNIDYKSLTYEEAFSKLKDIVEKIQKDQVSLEETVNLYKEGKLLSDRCNELLDSAKFEIEEIIKTENDDYKP